MSFNGCENGVPRNFVEHVLEVECDKAAGRTATNSLWLCDETVDLQLGGLDNKIHAIRNANCVVVG